MPIILFPPVRIICFLLGIASLLMWPNGANADTPIKKLGEFSSWKAFAAFEKDQKVCFMVAHAAKGNFKRAKGEAARQMPILTITFRPTETQSPIVSYEAGYVFHKGSHVQILVGENDHRLFTADRGAWARTASFDRAITQDILDQYRLQILAISEKGGKSRDDFDLKGSGKAFAAIKKACGL